MTSVAHKAGDDGGGGVRWYEFRLAATSPRPSQSALERALSSLSGVSVLGVSVREEDAAIVVKTPWTSEPLGRRFHDAIVALGYDVIADAPVESRFIIEGMTCASCAARIESHVRSLHGVEKASVNFSAMTALIVHNPQLVSARDLRDEIVGMGYQVKLRRTPGSTRRPPAGSLSPVEGKLTIVGLSSAESAARVQACVRRLSGVRDCLVDFSTGVCKVALEREGLLLSVGETIASMGYAVSVSQLEGAPDAVFVDDMREALERTGEIAEQKERFVGAAVLATPLALIMLLMATTNVMAGSRRMIFLDFVQLAISTPIVFHYGSVFFVHAWQSLRHGVFTMDTLVAIGSGCSYAYSLGACIMMLLTQHHLATYFDAAGMLIAFMLLGRFLEARAKRSTSDALIELMNLVPPVSIVVTAQGDVTVPSSLVEKGMRLRVLAGDRIPVDGTVVEGISDVDEQMVTGEAVPKAVRPGSAVIGGTTNMTAMLLVDANKIGEETMLSQILRCVQEAQNSKPEIQRIADRLATYFVPFVISFSVSVFFVWLFLGVFKLYPPAWRGGGETVVMFAFEFFIASVVAACPCALGLATPTAIMVCTGVGAKTGLLVKSGKTLEAVHHSRCIVFDKTGTITNGRLEVVFKRCWGGDADAVVKLVGFVEQLSNHPVAKAVAGGILAAPGPAEAYDVVYSKTHSGLGAEAVVRRKNPAGAEVRVHVGNLALMREAKIEVPLEVEWTVRQQNSLARTTIVGAVDGVARLVVALADQPKREAAGVLHFLQQEGAQVLLVTGDNKSVAAHVANAVGIPPENVYAERLPTAKADIVRQMQSEGHCVIFVGDGINDSPALAQADVGIALGAGTQIAIEAADVVLVSNSLVDILNLRALSITTVRRIYGNFFWAFGYNFCILPFASGMLYPLIHVRLPPILASAAMVCSSLAVLLSSLSIRCFKPYKADQFIEQA
ncbi:putative copper-transporting ATPase-like protein [Trypanosoma conorhini]|uniref:Putative copper-transporting ATPase-like protein n=1 Tax=Trypanosoma conorhini TaxID=83891 RepID=A0A422NJQ4_9TRYP|nr:putative copper-transporting ATPase-like protein [Trypanosoma conorhini]RNF05664.1 putative copper-transporting ATPase-like protein [Trypanosoma conorhini]